MTGSHAAPEDVGYQIKAAYIYNILQFVSFPDTALGTDGALNVCILGEDRFGGALEEIDGADLPQGRLNVVRLGSYGGEKSFDGCNALYVVESETRFIKSIIAGVDTRSTLTIGELPSFVGSGGLIELFVQNDRVRFRVNEELAKETDFQVAAQLIQLGVRR